ncbi:hypothetical protein CRUP_023170 [Coryphaenoides rupestris]|nr:hypothetical protein CRUP_023170 [Coryphaenoides rupestris]
MPKCPSCSKEVYFAMCLLQHDNKPYCHKPCYGAMFGPKEQRAPDDDDDDDDGEEEEEEVERRQLPLCLTQHALLQGLGSVAGRG